ncbi:hypothetical protein EON83_11165 [bacterium]|nr:MAG: hypothetical protein EON83_11165 [bacterium]
MNEQFLLSRGWSKLPDGRFGLWVSHSTMLALSPREAVEWQQQTDEALREAVEAVAAEPFVQRPMGFSVAGSK